MAKPPIKFYIELGSYQFKLVGLNAGIGTRARMHIWSVPAKGIRKGHIVDASLALATLETLIAKAEQFVGTSTVRTAKLLIPGYLLQCRSMESKGTIHDGIVTLPMQSELQEALVATASDDGSELVDSMVQAWNLDGFASAQFPAEKRGRTLSLVAFCSMCDSSVLTALIQVCNGAGIEITSLGSSSAAAAKLIASLTPDASNRVLFDLGHSHSHMLLQVGSRMNSSYSVAVGSQHMSRDVAAALGCELSEAESYKHMLGLAVAPLQVPALPPARDAETQIAAASMAPSTIYPWLAPRVAELLKLVHKHFALYAKALDGGVIVFGGGSLLHSLTGFMAHKWDGVNVTRFKPTSVSLSVALDIEMVCERDDSLLGFEGLIGSAAEDLQSLRAEPKNSLGLKGPQFLKPLLTWFSELAR